MTTDTAERPAITPEQWRRWIAAGYIVLDAAGRIRNPHDVPWLIAADLIDPDLETGENP